MRNDVDNFWNKHTIISDAQIKQYNSVDDSIASLSERMSYYPKFVELMELNNSHENEIILDYGCGAGHDLIRFARYSNAKTIIGMDISQTALNHAKKRIDLHGFKNIKLLNIESDEVCELPFKDKTIDYVYSCGVLHHATYMQNILTEFSRIMKDGAYGNIMVYNYDSLFLHLYIAYYLTHITRQYRGTPNEIFKIIADGGNCPIAKTFKPEEFISICEDNGLKCEFVGGYLSLTEIEYFNRYVEEAKKSNIFAESKDFLNNIKVEKDGLLTYKDKYAGLGGSFRISKK